MMVNTLQLSMCVVLFAEGRLQPGTPHWLLHLYMLTMSATFMYLLMSVWLAMHASVVVACEKARLLTQFVRLPIPTWRQFEHMRTSAASFETVGTRTLRVPFMDTALDRPLTGYIKDTSDANMETGYTKATIAALKESSVQSDRKPRRLGTDGFSNGDGQEA